MEISVIIATLIPIITPYLVKTGEKIAGEMGEDLWELIKKPFSKEEKKELLLNSNEDKVDIDEFKKALQNKLLSNEEYKGEIENAIKVIQNNTNQQIISNHGTVDKQINIQDNSGNIQM